MTLKDVADSSPAEAAKAKNLLLVAATWGEGEPPARAAGFYRALMAADAPRLEQVRFAVLALGDRAYANFCSTGRELDARLEALGGTRVATRVDCDLDFANPAAAWGEQVLAALRPAEPAVSGAEIIHLDFAPAAAAEPAWSRERPFPAEVLEHVNLNSSRSDKVTVHLELSLAGSGLAFEPGDALMLVPENDPAMVERAARRHRHRSRTRRSRIACAANSTSPRSRARPSRPTSACARRTGWPACSRARAGGSSSPAVSSSICSRLSRAGWRRTSWPHCCGRCRRAPTRSRARPWPIRRRRIC